MPNLSEQSIKTEYFTNAQLVTSFVGCHFYIKNKNDGFDDVCKILGCSVFSAQSEVVLHCKNQESEEVFNLCFYTLKEFIKWARKNKLIHK